MLFKTENSIHLQNKDDKTSKFGRNILSVFCLDSTST
jgi:hypothetical protein